MCLGSSAATGCSERRPPPERTSTAATERLITVGGAITETVFALGRGESVVAADTSSVFPDAVTRLPKVGYQRTLAAEGILALRPTRVLASEEAGPPAALEQLRSAGIPIEIIAAPATIEGARIKIRAVAQALSVPERGAQLVAQLDAELPPAQVARPGERKPKVVFVYTRGAGSLLVGGTGTGPDEMLRLAGAENAAASISGFKPLAAEALLAAQPDYLLLTSRGAGSLGGVESVLRAPGLASLPPERRPRVVTQDDLLLLGFGPRTGRAIAELRRMLTPPVAAAVLAGAARP